MQIRETARYAAWFASLTDDRARAAILVRIRRLSLGNPGDVRPVGRGISELRISGGPGYRVYFITRGRDVTVLLGGGDKGSQRHDIEEAIKLAATL